MSENLRLRLFIRRNGLPETRIVTLFPVNDDTTIVKLLEHVNELIPLETADWGLDDYAVELKSASGSTFECLHFQTVAHLLDKDEELIIRPLSSEDLKKRRLSGRHQISNDGRHLVDGVPFGRPKLRRAVQRPAVHIQSRKRRRVLYDDDDDDDGNDNGYNESLLSDISPVGLLTQYGDNLEDEDYGSRSDSDSDNGSDVTDSSEADPNLEPDELQLLREDAHSSTKQVKQVEFSQPEVPEGGTASTDSATSGSSYEDSDSSQDEAAEASADGEDNYNGDYGSDSEDSEIDSDSESESDSDSNISSENDASGQKDTNVETARDADQAGAEDSDSSTPLSQHSSMTDSNRAVPPDANTEQHSASPSSLLDHYVTANSASSEETGSRTEPGSQQFGAAGINSAQKTKTQKRNARRRAKRASDKARAEADGTSVENGASPVAENAKRKAIPDADAITPNACPAEASPLSSDLTPKTREDRRRLKLDVAAGRRMLFSALGIRNPEAKVSETKTGETPAPVLSTPAPDGTKEGQSSEASKQDEAAPKTSADVNSESVKPHWSERINYRAVECVDTNLVLDDPPYPFVQKWVTNGNSTNKTRKRNENDSASYDTSVPPRKRRRMEDDETSAMSSQDDLPSLPKDVSSLSPLEPGEVAAGMIITWKKWALSQKTNWQPQVVDVTAEVTEVMSDGKELQVILAQRDREFDAVAKQYDEETGKRVYGRFEVPDPEEVSEQDGEAESADDGVRVLLFSELLSPRVLKQPSS